jgi:ribosomal protein S25
MSQAQDKKQHPMDDLEGYLRQGEPDRAEKAQAWRTAIGLQRVDGLKPSAYLIETAKQHIEGLITIKEAVRRIDRYHAQLKKEREMHVPHADPVNTRHDLVNDPVNVPIGTVNEARGTVYDTVSSLMKQDKHITAVEISERLNLSLRTVRRMIKDLKEKGVIDRIGSDKTGHWKVIEP